MTRGVNNKIIIVSIMLFLIIFESTSTALVSSPSVSENEILSKENNTNINRVEKIETNSDTNIISKTLDTKHKDFSPRFDDKALEYRNRSLDTLDDMAKRLNYREQYESFDKIVSFFEGDDDNFFHFLRMSIRDFSRIPIIIPPGLNWTVIRRDIIIHRDILIMHNAKLHLPGTSLMIQPPRVKSGNKECKIVLMPGAELNIYEYHNPFSNDVNPSYITTDNDTVVKIENDGGKIFCHNSIIAASKSCYFSIDNTKGTIEFINNVEINNTYISDYASQSSLIVHNNFYNSQITLYNCDSNIFNNNLTNTDFSCQGDSRCILENNSFEGNSFLSISYNSRKAITNMKNNWINGINFDGSVRENDKVYYYNKKNLVIDGRKLDLNQDKDFHYGFEEGLITLYDCDNFTIQNSNLSNNQWSYWCKGIYCYNSTGKIINSTLQYNTYGIACESSFLQLIDNNLTNNLCGVSIPYNSKMTIPYMQGNWVNGVNIDGSINPEDKCYYYNEENLVIRGKIEDCGHHNGYFGSLTDWGIIILYDCYGITITDCDLSSNGDWWPVRAGIYSVQSHSIITNNKLHHNSYGIILSYKSTSSIYNGNIISYNWYGGIYIEDSHALKIEDNEIISNGNGIEIDNAGSYPIRHNNIYDNELFSISCTSSDPTISDNDIVGKRGYYDEAVGIFLFYSEPIIQHNNISNCHSGIFIGTGSNPIINNKNRIFQNAIGVNFGEEEKATIERNLIFNNNQGIFLYNNSLDLVVDHNNIFNNAFGIYCFKANPSITLNNFSNGIDIYIFCNQDCKPTITSNNFNLGGVAISMPSKYLPISAKDNYWGDADGPSGLFYPGRGARIEGLYVSWLPHSQSAISDAGCDP